MSDYRPLVSWTTIVRDVTVHATVHNYVCKVLPNDFNYPENIGVDTLTITSGFLEDNDGNIYRIEEVINSTTNEIRVYDIHEHSPAKGPAEDLIGYVFEWQDEVPISPTYLYKLDSKARDNVNIAEKITFWNHRGLQIDDGSTDENNVTKLTLDATLDWIASGAGSGWAGGIEGTLEVNKVEVNYWTLNGTDLYYTGGNVGVGTNTPSELFEVSGGNAKFIDATTPNSWTSIRGGRNILIYRHSTETSGDPGLFIMDAATENQLAGMNLDDDAGTYYGLHFRVTSDYSGTQQISIENGTTIGISYLGNAPPVNGLLVEGNVGIGDTSPSYKLDVNGTLRAVGAVTFDSTLGVTGAATLSSTLGVTGLATLTTLTVTGAATFDSTMGFVGIGTTINEISTDTTMAGDSDDAVPTEKATKAYVDNNVTSGEYLDYVHGQQVDGTLNPTLSVGQRYIVEDVSACHTNFKGSYGSVGDWITGESVGDMDIVEYDGTDFLVTFDSSGAGAGVTVTIGTDKNANANHQWYYSTGDTIWKDRGAIPAYTAGTGLDLVGTEFAIDSTVATLTGAQALTNKTGYNGLVITANTGVVTTGTWEADLITGEFGGTGVNNSGKTITLGGNFTTSGAYTLILTLTGATNVTLPTTGTLEVTTHNHTLDSLSNTTISSIASGEVLKWNGSAWINNTLSELGITESDIGDLGTYLENGDHWTLASGELYFTGNVGVGMTNPTTALEVTGVITISGGGGTSTNWKTAYDDSINTNPSFNTGTGVITFTQQDATTLTVDIDGRYEPSLTFGILDGNALKVTESVTATSGEIARFTSTGIESITNAVLATQIEGDINHNVLTNLDVGSSYLHLNSTEKGRVQNNADVSTDGYLTQADWADFNQKEDGIGGGTTSQYWRGDKTWQTFAHSMTTHTDYDANELIDHTAVTITAGTGLTGGGTIAASRTINADLSAINYWTLSGSDLYYSAGQVAIGNIASPTYQLELKPSSGGAIIRGYASDGDVMFLINSTSSDTYMELYADSSSKKIRIHTDGTTYFDGGFVAIGKISAGTELDVDGVITATGGTSTNWNTAYGWGDHSVVGYLTVNQTITLSGDVSGSGTTAITTTIGATKVVATMFNDDVVRGQSDIGSVIQSNDSILINDSSVGIGEVRKSDVSRLETYMQNNLTFSTPQLELTATYNYHTPTAFNGTATGDYNISIGHNSLLAVTTGGYSVAIGTRTLYSNTTGGYHIAIGHEALYSTTTQSASVGIGYRALRSATSGDNNTGAGSYSLESVTTGSYNTAFGYESLDGLIDGDYNVAVGYKALLRGTTEKTIGIGANVLLAGVGTGTIAIGYEIGQGALNTTNYDILVGYQVMGGTPTISGGYNIAIGYRASYDVSNSSNYNICIGYEAGYNGGASSTKNVFIGYQAGYNESGSNKLYIDNSNTSSPLLYGDFSLNRLVINGGAIHNVNNRTFFVNGDSGGTGAWNNDSDVRLKENTHTIKNPLDKVMGLRGVNYDWIDNREKGSRIGFIAQEVEGILPEVVTTGDTYSMQYSPITALLVEAIKEQQKEIEQLKQKIKGS